MPWCEPVLGLNGEQNIFLLNQENEESYPGGLPQTLKVWHNNRQPLVPIPIDLPYLRSPRYPSQGWLQPQPGRQDSLFFANPHSMWSGNHRETHPIALPASGTLLSIKK